MTWECMIHGRESMVCRKCIPDPAQFMVDAGKLVEALELQVTGACNRSSCNGRSCCEEMEIATEAKDKALSTPLARAIIERRK